MYIQTNFKHPKQIYKKIEQFENKIKKQNKCFMNNSLS